jgi:hypothetical protein
MLLNDAKAAVSAMIRARDLGGHKRDFISELNAIAASEVGRGEVAPEPTATADHYQSTALSGDDYPIEYYDDGYPKLPQCLDRRS